MTYRPYSNPMKKSIVFYISGHGFGHSSRMASVINALYKLLPDVRVLIKTSAPEWFFREQVIGDFEYFRREYDTGVIQSDSLNLDPRRTMESYAEFAKNLAGLIRSEVEFVERLQPQLIVGDIPPVAFEIAAAASLPSLAIGNFSWDWIYGPYVDEFTEYRDLIPRIREVYRKAGLLLRLPFAGGMDAFPRVRDVPLVARRSQLSREEVREKLSLPRERPVILLSFGGFRLGDRYYRNLSRIEECVWVASERVGLDLPGIRNVRREELRGLELGYPDLVKAADVVATKPGYGILSECIANRTAMLYTSRGNFREYPLLVKGAEENIPCRFIAREKLLAGDLKDDLFALLETEAPSPALPLNGAEVCAKIISKYFG